MDVNDETEAVASAKEDTDALISRLGVIEGQPLAERAAAFAQIYDSLQSTLGGGSGSSDTSRG
jgi:hypothetical protein